MVIPLVPRIISSVLSTSLFAVNVIVVTWCASQAGQLAATRSCSSHLVVATVKYYISHPYFECSRRKCLLWRLFYSVACSEYILAIDLNLNLNLLIFYNFWKVLDKKMCSEHTMSTK
jgi:hypothetical protein